MQIDFKKYPLPKRLRHHTAPNLYISANELKYPVDYYPPVIDKINWSDVFLNGKKPDMLDVGAGKGIFLLDSAELNPEKNILGFELRLQIVEWLNNLIIGENIPNSAVLWYNILNGFDFIESESIEKIFYLFPDPWPKTKHIKRRPFNNEVILSYHKILKKEGFLYIATDVEEVHDYHVNVLRKQNYFEYQLILPQDSNEIRNSLWKLPVTNKERFCLKHKIPVFRIICKKS
ncbi:MAG: tRNA (guanosine(46)-N7)-methyltransferase TrmB [Bacteroidota bacterium]